MSSPPAPARLGFDEWARLSVAQLKLAPADRQAILARAKVDPDAFRAADAHWNDVLAGDLAAGKTKRAERYAAACAEELAERRRSSAVAAPPPPAAPEPAPDPPPAAVKVDVEVPSFLRATPPAYAPIAEPFFVPPEPEPLFAPPEPERPHHPPLAGGTTDVDAILAAPALPFVERGPSVLPPPEAPASGSKPPPAPSGTIDVATLLAGPATPFARPPVPSRPHPAAVEGAKTTGITYDEVTIGGFTLHQYASLCAELAVHTGQTAAVLSRYGLPDEAARRQLAAHWEARLVADTELCRTWSELSAQYRQWLSRQQR